MSGIYGTVKPADIDINKDVEIFYHYRSSLNNDNSDFSEFEKLDISVLTKCKNGNNIISGLFNLRLPLEIFNKKGFYTIYIRPKEIETTIMNIGTLSAFPDIRGVVLSLDALSDFEANNALAGYRIEYGNDNNGNFKIITSSNKASSETTPTVTYKFDDSGRLIFCTVTPSLSPTFNPNKLPYIGKQGDLIKIVNTKFNPIMIDLEIVEHDAETLSYMIEGDQLVDKDNAIITTFNNRGEIYHQSEYGAYKDDYGTPLYEFKKRKSNVDTTQSFGNLE